MSFSVTVSLLLGVAATLSAQPTDDGYTVFTEIVAGRCRPGASCYPSQQELAGLDANLTGALLFQTDGEAYTQADHAWNTMFKSNPEVIVMVQSREDIQTAILFARKFNLHVTVKSSGHDIIGRSTYDDSFMINLANMKGKEVTLTSNQHPYGEVKVETGNTWLEIYQELDKYNRTAVGGSAHTVTPGGYTMGGGHSPITRPLGLAVDNTLEIQIVLADGRVATCTEGWTDIEHANGTTETLDDGDLFWALRGGGGGTFGVVVYYVFKLHESRPMVQLYAVFPWHIEPKAPYPGLNKDIGLDVLEAYFKTVKSLSDDWGGYMLTNNGEFDVPADNVKVFVPIRVKGTIHILLEKYGPWDEHTEDVYQYLEAIDPAYRSAWSAENRTDFMDYEQDKIDAAEATVYLLNSYIPAANLTDGFIRFLDDTLFGSNNPHLNLGCVATLVGGAASAVPDSATPVHPGFRDAIMSMTCHVEMTHYEPDKPARFSRAASFARALKCFGDGEYINEPYPWSPNWKRDFWGPHYEALMEIKVRYDPDNFFTCLHCLGSDAIPLSAWNSTVVPEVYSAQYCSTTASHGTVVVSLYWLIGVMGVAISVLYTT